MDLNILLSFKLRMGTINPHQINILNIWSHGGKEKQKKKDLRKEKGNDILLTFTK